MTGLIVIASKHAAYIAARQKMGDHRKVCDSIEGAFDVLRGIYATAGFPQEFPTVAAGVGLVDVTGDDSIPPLADWPEEYRTEGVMVCVTFIGTRDAEHDGKKANGARGFAVYPLHPIDAIRGDESGEDWLWKVVEKESSHVALRGLRNVASGLGTDALSDAAKGMPLTVADYVEESTRESLDTSAFDGIWKQFRKMLAESPATAALVSRLPSKADVLKAIRSEAYAKAEYEDLEAMGAFRFIGENMAAIVDAMRAAAVANGDEFEYDSSEIRGWLTNRATKVFATARKVEADLSTVDFAAFAGGLKAALPTATASEEGGEAGEEGNGE